MSVFAKSFFTETADSAAAGRQTAASLLDGLDAAPKLVIVYLTDSHDQQAFLHGLTETLGDSIPVIGCSGQGVTGRGMLVEDSYGASAMVLGGRDFIVSTALIEEIETAPFEKGRALAEALKKETREPTRVAVLHYDALSGVDMGPFLEGFHSVADFPVVGGAAGHAFFYDGLKETCVYFGNKPLCKSAVAFSLSGSFDAILGIAHGCAPIGIEMTVTKSEGNRLLELDGKPAILVWEDICGPMTKGDNMSTMLAIGVPKIGEHEETGYLLRSAYFLDPEKGVGMGDHIPEGTNIMLHHRTVDDVLNGTQRMADDVKKRLQGRSPKAVMTFECGARTKPFLGIEGARRENLALQSVVGIDAAWVGMLAWGELFPTAGKPSYHNYAFPILVLID